MTGGPGRRTHRALAVAATLGLLSAGCAHRSPQDNALSACKAFLAAGLGDQGTPPKARKGRLAASLKDARRAAVDERWAPLATAIGAVQAQEERDGYTAFDHLSEADSAQRRRVVEEWQLAGLGP